MALLLKLRVLSLAMGVFDSSYRWAVGVKWTGLKTVLLIFSGTLIMMVIDWFLSAARRSTVWRWTGATSTQPSTLVRSSADK